jgi:hypothetical protein
MLVVPPVDRSKLGGRRVEHEIADYEALPANPRMAGWASRQTVAYRHLSGVLVGVSTT